MKTALTLFVLAPAFAFGQSLVSNIPQNRTALLEDFTGIHCGYCPDGHVIMADLAAVHGDKLVNVGIHANLYAVPSGSEPDFRTPDGDAIDAHFAITGYPSGVINRHAVGGVMGLGRGAWEGAVNDILDVASPVNVGVESSYDGTNLTVHVVGLYTANSPAGNDYISVLVKENHLNGPQTDYTNGNHANYDHMHVLRGYITDTWGEDVGNHVAGEQVEDAGTTPRGIRGEPPAKSQVPGGSWGDRGSCRGSGRPDQREGDARDISKTKMLKHSSKLNSRANTESGSK